MSPPPEETLERITIFCISIGIIGLVLFGLSIIISFLYIITPKWILYGVPFAVALYFFDKLPLQHYWNPSVRELYPHRQWAKERAAMQLLHRLKVIPASRVRGKQRRLPPELWSMIVKHAIDVPFCFDTTCEAKNFNLFLDSHKSRTRGYEQSEIERKKLRLVCKLWSYLLSGQTMRWVADKPRWTTFDTGLLRADLGSDKYPTNSQSVITAITNCTDQVQSLTTLSINPHILGVIHVLRHLLDHCQENQLAGIRSLVLDCSSWCLEYIIPVYYVQRMQETFSRLRFLRLQAIELHGGLALEDLEILYLDIKAASSFEPSQWHLPSLRHLAFGLLQGRPFDVDQLPGISENLLSLLLLDHNSLVVADNRFWSKLPSLEFFGIRAEFFNLADDPPLSHPLSHLYLAESQFQWSIRTPTAELAKPEIDHFSSIIRRLPRIKAVILPSLRDSKLWYPEEWQALFRLHRSRGIIWLDRHGKAVIAGPIRTVPLWEKRMAAIWILGSYFLFLYSIWNPSHARTLVIPYLVPLPVSILWGCYKMYLA